MEVNNGPRHYHEVEEKGKGAMKLQTVVHG
jgi:hypothetical protein